MVIRNSKGYSFGVLLCYEILVKYYGIFITVNRESMISLERLQNKFLMK